MIPANNSLFPALYLYPLNDTWHPKHISLTSQRTKIGRQTSSKTAPGERNGFFDSKVLSRQHAEVWEDGSKIYIKDVKSSNGTFINGERLSSEGHESEPFELKSDDIVEFGIDIVGEDNKTIIHHKVAARVACVFSEQDAQVAARAEAHQQQQQQQQAIQQHQQQQQYMQQAHAAAAAAAAGGQGSMAHAGPSGINTASSVTQGQPGSAGVGSNPYPSFSVQRRAQLAQQGLGGMGGMRPPGKTGLSFDVILSRLQGELQKSKQTGHELDTLTGAMHVIQDTLGGSLPGPLPPFPSNLPPVRPPQDAPQPLAAAATDIAVAPTVPSSAAASPEQPSAAPSAAASAAAVIDLQSQLRDTQSSLASHLDKVRALEGVLAEQESMRREVRTLREMMDERRLERERAETAHLVHQHTHAHESEEPRGGFDLEEDEEDRVASDDDDDDARSISTVIPHELERVEEEDEDQIAEEESGGLEDKLLESEKQEEEEDLLESEEEERARRREDLGLGRPRTPEPSRMGLDYTCNVSRRASITSPLSHHLSSSEDMYDQVQKLSKQVTAVMALTTTLEAQHSAAQTTIQTLESKVGSLEGMLKIAEEALKAKAVHEEEQEIANREIEVKEEEEKNDKESLTEMLTEWKKSVEGQWSHVQEEWKEERERLNKAREEWETKLGAALTAATANASTNADGSSSLLVVNGDVFKHNGLVTPPSPRSQPSNSPRYRRRRRRPSSSSPTGERGRSMSPISDGEEGDVDPDTDATLANSDEASSSSSPRGTKTIAAIAAAAGLSAAAVSATDMQVHKTARSLATPEPLVYKLSSHMDDTGPNSKARTVAADDGSDVEQTSLSLSLASSSTKNSVSQYPATDSTTTTTSMGGPSLNFHAAVGVLVLSVAAAAVFWKVKPE